MTAQEPSTAGDELRLQRSKQHIAAAASPVAIQMGQSRRCQYATLPCVRTVSDETHAQLLQPADRTHGFNDQHPQQGGASRTVRARLCRGVNRRLRLVDPTMRQVEDASGEAGVAEVTVFRETFQNDDQHAVHCAPHGRNKASRAGTDHDYIAAWRFGGIGWDWHGAD